MKHLPDAYISHRTPQRLRLKIPSEEGDAGYFLAVKKKLSEYHVVERFEINPVTGSILFLHEQVQQVDVVAIAEYAETNKLFRLKVPTRTQTGFSGAITDAFLDANERVRDFSGDQVNVPDLAFIGLLGLGIFQLSTGGITAPLWHAGLWYGYNIFYHSYQQQPDKMEAHLEALTAQISAQPDRVNAQIEDMAVQLNALNEQLGKLTAQLEPKKQIK